MLRWMMVLGFFAVSNGVYARPSNYKLDCGALENHFSQQAARNISMGSCQVNCNGQIKDCVEKKGGQVVDFTSCRIVQEYITPDPRNQQPIYWVSARGEGTCQITQE